MKLKQAEAIFNSFGTINVTYKNNPVWIQDIQQSSCTVHVKDLKTGRLLEVPVSELKEE